MGHEHNHGHGGAVAGHEKPLWWALGLTGSFLVVEVIGAFMTNSLALLSDAAHMGTDTLALMVALIAVRLSRRPPDAKRTYGYVRLEAVGAVVNGVMLFVVAGYVLWKAVVRFQQPQEIASTGMLVVAGFGLVVNLIAMRLLFVGSKESLNVKGAYLEVLSDMLGSVAVIIGALVIGWTGWLWVDSVLAVLIGLWILPRTWVLLREAGNVLMEGVPKGVKVASVREMLEGHAEVLNVHELHVWALASRTAALTAHVVVGRDADIDGIRRELGEQLRLQFDIGHSTLQMEMVECGVEPCGKPLSLEEVHAHHH